MRLKWITVPIVIGVATFANACGSSTTAKPTPTSAPAAAATPVSDQEFRTAASTAADTALLLASDLPAGWSGKPHSPSDLTGFTGDCASLSPDDPIAGSLVMKSSNDFSDAKGGEATSQVDVFRTAAQAADSIQTLLGVAGRCHDQFISVFTQLFQQFAPGSDPTVLAQNVQVSFDDRPVAALGDVTHAYRLAFSFTVRGISTSGTTDVVFIQRGRLIGQVSRTAFDGNTTLGDRLATIIADRLTSADRSLPQ